MLRSEMLGTRIWMKDHYLPPKSPWSHRQAASNVKSDSLCTPGRSVKGIGEPTGVVLNILSDLLGTASSPHRDRGYSQLLLQFLSPTTASYAASQCQPNYEVIRQVEFLGVITTKHVPVSIANQSIYYTTALSSLWY